MAHIQTCHPENKNLECKVGNVKNAFNVMHLKFTILWKKNWVYCCAFMSSLLFFTCKVMDLSLDMKRV